MKYGTLYAWSPSDYDSYDDAVNNVATYKVSLGSSDDPKEVYDMVNVAKNVTIATNNDPAYLAYTFVDDDGGQHNEGDIYRMYMEQWA